MLTNFYKILLFVSSFMPLYVILMVKFYDFEEAFFKNIKDNSTAFVFLLTLILISVLTFMYFYFCELNSETSFSRIENKNSEILTYFITYIVPITTLNVDEINSIIINFLLFFVIGVFYVKSDLFYLNILFTLTGFNVYIDVNNKVVLSKKSADRINDQGPISVRKVGEKIYIINKK
ncbi:hypothetical protein [Salimicrobium salexigens]|uniref:Uncharacterized protein n=1 Tax=Salimicrobium salexigens TaxID=908941 RepID=A0ABY1KQU8_9BACI|nr:hypothetical protein [Salimicrobium salexigens]SIS66547.1 hypothetical protein SAMN05421758_103265 [Salimicrobium salexigens]